MKSLFLLATSALVFAQQAAKPRDAALPARETAALTETKEEDSSVNDMLTAMALVNAGIVPEGKESEAMEMLRSLNTGKKTTSRSGTMGGGGDALKNMMLMNMMSGQGGSGGAGGTARSGAVDPMQQMLMMQMLGGDNKKGMDPLMMMSLMGGQGLGGQQGGGSDNIMQQLLMQKLMGGSSKDSSSSLLPLMMMQGMGKGNGGASSEFPLAALTLGGSGNKSKLSSLLPLLMMQQQQQGGLGTKLSSCRGMCGMEMPKQKCGCDALCLQFGDCCSDYNTHCTVQDVFQANQPQYFQQQPPQFFSQRQFQQPAAAQVADEIATRQFLTEGPRLVARNQGKPYKAPSTQDVQPEP